MVGVQVVHDGGWAVNGIMTRNSALVGGLGLGGLGSPKSFGRVSC